MDPIEDTSAAKVQTGQRSQPSMVKDGRAASSSDEDFKQLPDDSDGGDGPDDVGRADSSSDDEFGLADDDSDGVEPQPQPQPQPKVAAQKP